MDDPSNSRSNDPSDPVNVVRLRGRLGADPAARELPSGAQIVTVRVVVARDQTVMTRGSRQRSDWVECSAWTSALRRKVGGWHSGDIVEIEGALRRRHYRAGDGGSSVVEIELLDARRLQRQPTPA